jgi:Cu2+-exporting ATPase
VSVLIVTCPCALSLAAPATLVAAARGLARRGVLVQRLDALERLAAVQQVFFDKTGTLTEDRLQLRELLLSHAGRHAFAGADDALRCAASLAAWSSHPLARALVQACPAAPSGAVPTPMWTAVEEVAGLGVRALDPRGREWRLGSATWVGTDAAPDTAESHLHLSCSAQVLASVSLEESLRPGTEAALHELQRDGVHVTLLTGDAPLRAAALAQRLGVLDVRARATPEDKLAAVAQAQGEGRCVAMVGDGINDAPVLARADVSLAMGQGALVSRSQADAVITSNLLGDLVRARQSARRAVRIVRQNFAWAAAYNAISIPLALAGWLPPWAAGLGMACSSLVVVLNALRASR